MELIATRCGHPLPEGETRSRGYCCAACYYNAKPKEKGWRPYDPPAGERQ